jgi:hypothetical protein
MLILAQHLKSQSLTKIRLFFMKSIRNIAFSAFLTFAAFSAVTLASCSKDECKDVNCNTGTCNEDDGSCTCPTGFEGTSCETEMRTKFYKNNTAWSATDKKTGSTDEKIYTSTIVPGTAITEVKIGSFGDIFETKPVVATVSANTINIASQDPDNDGYQVEGSGSYNTADKTITWTYTITSPISGKSSFTGTWR